MYGIRSQDNWGIGDFRDLERIINMAGKIWKAATIGLQPLHSLTSGLRSPYSPSSRLCWNPLYLNIEQVAEFRTSSKLQAKSARKNFRLPFMLFDLGELVNYDAVETLKMAVLEDLYRVFKRTHFKRPTMRGRKFLQFVQQSLSTLGDFVYFKP